MTRILYFFNNKIVPTELPALLFICYGGDQIDWTRKIGNRINQIHQSKILAWWDERKSTGDYWDDEIEQKLDDADAFLLMLSPSFFNPDSYIQIKELPIILRRHGTEKIRVLPILVEELELSQRSESWLNEIDIYPHRGFKTLSNLFQEELEDWIKNLTFEAVWRRMEKDFAQISQRTLDRPFQSDLKFPDGTRYQIGRELHEKLNNWTDDTGGQKIAFLIGEAGSGKSAILHQYVKNLYGSKNILYIDARDHTDTTDFNEFFIKLEIFSEEEAFFKQIEKIHRITVCIDSLDVICWTPITFRFFLRLIQRLYTIEGIQLILATRVFDLNNNADLLLLKELSNVFQLDRLSLEVTQDTIQKAGIVIPEAKSDRKEILNFFSLPLYLKILFMIKDVTSSPLLELSTETSLFSRIWKDKVTGKNLHLDQLTPPLKRRSLAYLISHFALERRQLDIPLSVLENNERYSVEADEALSSEGFIRGVYSRGFFHQTMLDHVTVYRFMEIGWNPDDFVSEYSSDFFAQPILRVFLSYLHIEKTDGVQQKYISSIEKILSDESISRIWKLNSIRFLAELSDPGQGEIELVNKLLIPDSFFEIYFIRHITYQWFYILLELKYLDRLQISIEGMAHYRLLNALLRKGNSETESKSFPIYAEGLLKQFQPYSAREMHKLLLRLNQEDQIRFFPHYINYLLQPGEINGNRWFLGQGHKELFQSVSEAHPDLVLEAILSADFHSIIGRSNFEDFMRRLLEKNPLLIHKIINYLVILLKKEKQDMLKTWSPTLDLTEESFADPGDSSISAIPDDERKKDLLSSPYEYDHVCVYNTDRNTFYFDEYDIYQFWAKMIEKACSFHAKKGSPEYPALFNALLETPYETPVRIAFLSSLLYKSEKLFLRFYIDPIFFRVVSLEPILIQRLPEIREKVSEEWSQVENTIFMIGHYRKSFFGDDFASNFYLEIRTALKGLPVSSKMNIEFSWAEPIFKKRIESWNLEHPDEKIPIQEFVELEARHGGITDVRMGGAAVPEHEYEEKPLNERLQLLIDHGPGSKTDRSVGFWWVENGRNLERIFLKNPESIQDDLHEIARRPELYPYRGFLIRAITSFLKQKIEAQSAENNGENTNPDNLFSKLFSFEKATRNVLELSEGDRPDLGDDYKAPVSDFLHFIEAFYKYISPESRKLIRDKFHSFLPGIPEIAEHLSKTKNQDDGWNALQNSANTQMGRAIDAAMTILYFEKEAPEELKLIQKMSISEEASNRVAVAVRLLNLKNNYKAVADQIIKTWNENHALSALQFAIRYYHHYWPSEIPEILNYLEQWIHYLPQEACMENHGSSNNRSHLPHYSLSGATVKFLLDLAESEKRARETLETIFEEDIQDYYLLRIEAIHHILDYYLNPLSEYFHQLLQRIASDPFPEVRSRLIQSICLRGDKNSPKKSGKIHDYPELVQELLSQAIKKGDLSDGFLSHVIKKYLHETWKNSPSWCLEVIEMILIENKVAFYEHELSDFAHVIKSIYIYEKEFQKQCSTLLNVCIDRGWDGLDDLYGLGRE